MAITCTPTSLQQNAACFCGSQDLQYSEITYLLAVLSGGSQVPSSVYASAKLWLGIDAHFTLADQAYLLAVLAGTGTNASTLAQASACYCFSTDLNRAAAVYLLATAANVSSASLPQKAACFCFDQASQLALQGYLLALNAGGSLDPAAISQSAAAAGFLGLPDTVLWSIWLYCACAWAQKKIVPTDPVLNWVYRVGINGGAAPSQATITAMQTFVAALQTAGIWTNMRTVCCFVPDNLIAAITPLVNSYGNDPWKNSGSLPFTGGILSVNGLVGNGSAYLDTGFLPAQHFAAYNNAGLSLCISQTSSAGAKFELAAFDGSNLTCGLWQPSGFGLTGDLYGPVAGSGLMAFGALVNTGWFISANRKDSTGLFGQLSGGNTANAYASLVNLGSNTSNSVPAYSLFSHARNNKGNADSQTTRTISFAAAHDALTLTQATALFNAVQALRTALGGGNV